MMWGRPTARTYDQNKILELTRMYMIDEAPKNSESKALKIARKYIRKNMPQIKGLIAYSSLEYGHEGAIYKADNWFNLGRTQAKAWNRKGRKNIDPSSKLRWVRSV